MALPPSGYPQIRGKACGEDWTVPTEVTGHLPGTGFGSLFKHTISPITNNYPLIINIGSERDEQLEYGQKIRTRVKVYRGLVTDAKQAGPLRFTKKERQSINWLLNRADAYIDGADDLWIRWQDREGGAWPLDLGDDLGSFAGGVCPPAYKGSWVQVGERGQEFLCPSQIEIDQRVRDRRKIGKLFSDALAHIYCAAYGYWRLRLYKQAWAAYQALPTAGIGDIVAQPPAPGPGPDLVPDLGLVSREPPIDPCKDLGIDCPPGEEPDDCPGGWCPPDPTDLPDPEDVPEIEPEGLGEGPLQVPSVVIAKARRRAKYMIAGGVGTLVVTGIVVAVMR